MRAFVKLREILATHRDLARRLDEMESKYDAQFKVVFDAIRELMTPPQKSWRRIGFTAPAAGKQRHTTAHKFPGRRKQDLIAREPL